MCAAHLQRHVKLHISMEIRCMKFSLAHLCIEDRYVERWKGRVCAIHLQSSSHHTRAHTGIHKHSGWSLHLSIFSAVPVSSLFPSLINIAKPLISPKSFFIIFSHCQGCKGHQHLREAFHWGLWNGFIPNGLFILQLRWISSVMGPDEVAFLI